MNQNLKFMTVEEFMNTMKRRGTADGTTIKSDMPSPNSFKRHLEQKNKDFVKQQVVLQKLSSQTKSNQSCFRHYYINERVKRPPYQLNSGINIVNINEQFIKENEIEKRFQQKISSNQLIDSQKDIIDDQLNIQQEIINDFHKVYVKQRFFSPPQNKRDLDNLEDYFQRSRNYQAMNKMIRKNSCECLQCGGRCNKLQDMKGIIPQFIPRQVIRNCLKKKWKKVTKTLRKLCFFFKLAAGGHTKPKNNGNRQVNQQKQRNVINQGNSVIAQGVITAMINQSSYSSPSNDHVRQILSNDPSYPPFLNLKNDSIQESEDKQNQRVDESGVAQQYNEQQNSFTNLPMDDNSSDSSFHQQDIESLQIRKALDKVDDNFFQELTQRRNIPGGGEKKSRIATFIRSNSRLRTQNNSALTLKQRQKDRSILNVQEGLQKQKVSRAYSRFLVQPHPKLIDIVNQYQKPTQNSKTNITCEIQTTLKKSTSKNNTNQNNPLMSPLQSSPSKFNLQNVLDSSKSVKKSEYYTERKKSNKHYQANESQCQSQNGSFIMIQDTIDKMIKNDLNISASSPTSTYYLNQIPQKVIRESLDIERQGRKKQSNLTQSAQANHIGDIYKASNKINSSNMPASQIYHSSSETFKNTAMSILNDKKRNIPMSFLNEKNQSILKGYHSQNNSQEKISQRSTLCNRKDNQPSSVFKDKLAYYSSQIPQKQKIDVHQLRIFEKSEIKSIKQDIFHLNKRSLHMCQNKDTPNNRQLQSPHLSKPQKQITMLNSPTISDQEGSISFQISNRFKTKEATFILPTMNQSRILKDEEVASIFLKKQTFQKTQTQNIRFDV